MVYEKLSKIFISYSHLDTFYHDKLLKYFPNTKDYISWSDKSINVGDNWQDEIDAALEEASVVVVLLSTNFFKSEYIRNVEMRRLLGACESRPQKVKIAPIWIGHVTRSEKEEEFLTELSNGSEKKVSILKYQAINKSSLPVIELIDDECELERFFVKTVDSIYDLYEKVNCTEQNIATASKDFKHPVLNIRLDRDCDSEDVVQKYSAGEFSCEKRMPIEALMSEETGERLFKILFNSEEKLIDTLNYLFQTKGEFVTTLAGFGKLRVRVQVNDDEWASEFWQKTCWQGMRLIKRGWSFENCSVDININDMPHPCLEVTVPSKILVIAPRPDSFFLSLQEAHINALERYFNTNINWRSHETQFTIVSTYEEYCSQAASSEPFFLYYFGCIERQETKLHLKLNNADGSINSISLSEMQIKWQDNPPSLAYFNLLVTEETSIRSEFSQLSPLIPLVITQHQDITSAKNTVDLSIKWFNSVFVETDEVDPIAALNHLTCATSAWTAYEEWKCNAQPNSNAKALIRLLLDRTKPRTSARNAVDLFRHRKSARVAAIIATGKKSDCVDLFAKQMEEHLQRNNKAYVNVCRIPIRMPLRGFALNFSEFDQYIRRKNGIYEWPAWIKQQMEAVGDGRIPLLLLEFIPDGRFYKKDEAEKLIGFLANYCCSVLSKKCPKGWCLIASLTIETEADLKEYIIQLQEQLEEHATFSLELAEPLKDINKKELLEFIRDEDVVDPKPNNTDLRNIRNAIHEKCSGRFNETALHIENGMLYGWQKLLNELTADEGKNT